MFGKVLPRTFFSCGKKVDRYSLREYLSKGKKIVERCIQPPVSLPPYQEYNLDVLIEAGIKLEQLNPNILGITPISDIQAKQVMSNYKIEL